MPTHCYRFGASIGEHWGISAFLHTLYPIVTINVALKWGGGGVYYLDTVV